MLSDLNLNPQSLQNEADKIELFGVKIRSQGFPTSALRCSLGGGGCRVYVEG